MEVNPDEKDEKELSLSPGSKVERGGMEYWVLIIKL